MIRILMLLLMCGAAFASCAQTPLNIQPDPQKTLQVVKAGCGKCMFYLRNKECLLAVRIKGKTYLVEGTTLQDHGDEHAKEGMCSKVRKAKVQGEIINDNYIASYFKLVDKKEGKKKNRQSLN